jgi:hypothetical protein
MLEITDLLWRIDDDGALLPTVKTEVVASLLDHHQRQAARIVSGFPDNSALGIFGVRRTLPD